MNRTDSAQSDLGMVGVERAGEIVILTIDHAPINALNLTVRRRLLATMQDADDSPEVRAIIVQSKGRHFVAGRQATS
jgi:3-hydroxyacyl-CoA dehydrogenase